MTMTNDILQNYISSISSKYTYEETSEVGYHLKIIFVLLTIKQKIWQLKGLRVETPQWQQNSLSFLMTVKLTDKYEIQN